MVARPPGGGGIWVKSEVGIGSTFTVTIPVRRGE
jgi:signal transduction histidine kinase